MPPVSEKQRRFMRFAEAHPKEAGVSKKVAHEFNQADPGGKLPEKKKAVDRSAHYKGNPGFPSSSEAGGSPPPKTYQAHEAREKEVMGAGYQIHEAAEKRSFGGQPHRFNAPAATGAHSINPSQRREGHLRMSGHKGAHRIGKR